jgi:hypothetical protein
MNVEHDFVSPPEIKGTKMNNEKSAGKIAERTGVDMKLEVVFSVSPTSTAQRRSMKTLAGASTPTS